MDVATRVALIVTASFSSPAYSVAMSLSEAQPARVIAAASSQYVVIFFIVICLHILFYCHLPLGGESPGPLFYHSAKPRSAVGSYLV